MTETEVNAVLDDDFSKVIVTRESPTSVADAFVRDIKSGASTRVTGTASMPWPTLAMSNVILSPTEMLAAFLTRIVVSPALASAAR